MICQLQYIVKCPTVYCNPHDKRLCCRHGGRGHGASGEHAAVGRAARVRAQREPRRAPRLQRGRVHRAHAPPPAQRDARTQQL